MEQEHIFAHSEDFWDYAQSSLRCESPGELSTVNKALVKYLKLVGDHILVFVNDDQDLYRCGLSLVCSEFYESNKQFCVSKQLSLLSIDGLDQNIRLFSSYVLLLDCKNDSSQLQVMYDYHAFSVLYRSLRQLFETFALLDDDRDMGSLGILRKTCTVQLDIMFQMCKYMSISYEELQLIDTFFINYIFESLVVADVDDVFNAAKFKLILAMNEQFMIAARQHHHHLENKVLSVVATHTTFRNFSECLLMFFNREEDRCLQIMISKIIYLIFTSKKTADVFYHNDLNVMVDVLIRELTNLSEEDDSIRHTFLRVLYPLLQRKQFEASHYKKAELVSLLTYLSGIGQTFWVPSDTTKRLASRCLKLSWLQPQSETTDDVESIKSDHSSIINDRIDTAVSSTVSLPSTTKNGHIIAPPQLPHQHHRNSDTSLASMSKKITPPPPVPRHRNHSDTSLPYRRQAPPPPPPSRKKK